MIRISLPLGLLATVLTCSLPPVAAQAQPIRTFVALTGSDANTCTFASPCKSAQHAHDVAAAGGEIRMLDPGSYGLLTISKAISILGDGHGGIAASGGATAITINAGASDKINLRGVLLEGFGSGATGITFNTGGSLSIQDCMIRNFTGAGVSFVPSVSSELSMSGTVIADNVGHGISIDPVASAVATAVLDHIETAHNAGNGLSVDGRNTSAGIKVTLSESVSAHNSQSGVLSISTSAPTAVMVRNSTIANNVQSGLSVSGPADTLRFTRSTITGNAQGLTIFNSGTLTSYGDNNVDGNVVNGAASNVIVLN